MRKIALFTTAATLIVAATAAQADSWGKPCTSALSVEALQAKLESQGYKVLKGKVNKACGEFYTTDKAGAKVEVFVDPTNGTIVDKI